LLPGARVTICSAQIYDDIIKMDAYWTHLRHFERKPIPAPEDGHKTWHEAGAHKKGVNENRHDNVEGQLRNIGGPGSELEGR
jgi:hypothetical protein